MTERAVDIPVSKNLRDKIKKLKRELTYEEFLRNLIKKEGISSPKGYTTSHQERGVIQ